MMIHIGFSPEGDKVRQDDEGGPHGMPGCQCTINKHGMKKPYRQETLNGIDFDSLVSGVNSMEELASRFNDNPDLFQQFATILSNMVGEQVGKIMKNYPGIEQSLAPQPMEQINSMANETDQQELPPELMQMMEQIPLETEVT